LEDRYLETLVLQKKPPGIAILFDLNVRAPVIEQEIVEIAQIHLQA
jgi:hypothetical protein